MQIVKLTLMDVVLRDYLCEYCVVTALQDEWLAKDFLAKAKLEGVG